MSDDDLDRRAIEILRGNDRGGYTVPTHGLYPFQWNWDSAFVALGLAVFDQARAWQELETLASAQWPDGMFPHIVFHVEDEGYFPGPEQWGTNATPPTSGYSNPPVLASSVRRLVSLGGAASHERARSLFPKMLRWHRWLHARRDPQGLGVLAVAHPWESGRDNLPDWDASLASIDTSRVGEYRRRDTSHVDSAMRPKKRDYDAYMALVAYGRECGWEPEAMARGPFLVADVGMTLIGLRADRDLLWLAHALGEGAAVAEIESWIDGAEQGLERLWNADVQAYCNLDLRTGARGGGVSSAAFLACGARAGAPHHAALLAHFERIGAHARYCVPSYDPAHPDFDALRYWRGPVWAVVNFQVAGELAAGGYAEQAKRVRSDTRELIRNAGFFEYFCPLTGRGAGGGEFSWTAAMWLAWASPNAPPELAAPTPGEHPG